MTSFETGKCPKCGSEDVRKDLDIYANTTYFFEDGRWINDGSVNTGDKTGKGSYNCQHCGNYEEIDE